ncbi:hypothetical protein SCL_1444 [Sulfuricaulis limicola]|uniref:Phage abortive infection protein n=1 Tax=Sulfuricaulis limicola TaxID=1620215 RepID=A0A1B4XG46_9GAMM|nr:putative phage abortive infection protein [Sulfuricaulis limicola]BAV33755.1 hypothetical protein SCL_1444 [Sulfuricaulis limicola]
MEKMPKEPGNWQAIGLIAFVVLCWLGLGFYASSRPEPGEFGDMFGSVNALFSGLAFAGLIYAIWLQRIELRLQRRELEATRAELAGQRAQMEAQNRTLRKQNFEDTFFQLLRLHNDIVNAIDLVKTGEGGRITKGRDCFSVFYKRLREKYAEKQEEFERGGIAVQHFLNEVYLAFYKEHEAELGHYFRSLYNIVKFIKNSEVPDKRLYTNLVRAQLSSNELLLIFYNCLSKMGNEKFRPLTVEFNILKHLQTDQLLKSDHASLYY